MANIVMVTVVDFLLDRPYVIVETETGGRINVDRQFLRGFTVHVGMELDLTFENGELVSVEPI